MRDVVLNLAITLDSYIARPDGAVDYLFMPEDYPMADFLATVDTVVMGRKTLDSALSLGGDPFCGMSMETYVFSRCHPAGERHGVVFVNQSPAEWMDRIRERPGKRIWLMGGGELAGEFLRADLVDDMELSIVPILHGEGIPLFPTGFPQRDFVLVESRTYSKGLVSLKYQRCR
jgi:dihydrofolate reductase